MHLASAKDVPGEYSASMEDPRRTGNALPQEFTLLQNYPNPFKPSTTISFTIPKAANVQLKVFNVLGQEVATLVSGTLTAGTHSVTFDASRLGSGVYIYRFTGGTFSETRKMVLVK